LQNTLLGLAIAIIVALIAALVGPHFVEWSNHRAQFEAVASRLVGLPVRVTGPIDVRLLPTPSLRLNGIEIGPASGDGAVRAKSLAFELALGPLLRGKFRAAETHLVGPEFKISVNKTGSVDWPPMSIGFNPDTLSIDHLNIDDGHAVLTDAASGARLVLDQLSFDGEVRSLAGSFKGDGSFVSAGALYGYRMAASRVAEARGLHLRLGVYPTDPRLLVDAEGTLSFTDGAPRFEGTISVARPADLASAREGMPLKEAWHANAQVKATPTSALFEQTEFQYGPEERGIKLSGTAELKLGDRPRFDAVLSGRQLDIDRVLAQPEASGRTPLAAIQAIAASLGAGLRPPVPVRLGLSLDTVTLSGTTIQVVRGDISGLDDALTVEQLEFRAPGSSQVQISGRLDLAPLTFNGPISIDSQEPRTFAAWLAGHPDPASAPKEPLRASGDVTLASDRLQVERLKLKFGRETIDGRVAYVWAATDHPTRFEAEIRAPTLDVEAAQTFVKAALRGTQFDWPSEISLAVMIGRVTIAGTDARQAEARLRLDRDGLHVDRLALADLGGASFELSGNIDGTATAPRGHLVLTLDAHDFSGVAALLARYGVDAAEPLRGLGQRFLSPVLSDVATWLAQSAAEGAEPLRHAGQRFVPAELHGMLELEDGGVGKGTEARLGLNGHLGAVRIARMAVVGQSGGAAAAEAQVLLEGEFTADDGSALAALFGIDRLVAVDNRPARLSVAANGPWTGDISLDSRVVAGGLDATAKGTLRLFDGHAPSGSFKVSLVAADARALRRKPTGAKEEPLPLAFNAHLGINASTVTFDDLSGRAAGSSLRGQLTAILGHPIQLTGTIETDTIDASAAIAAVAGLPVQSGSRSELALWSPEPFAPWFSFDFAGAIKLKAARAKFTPSLVVQQARTLLRFGPSEFAIEDLGGTLAGGHLASELSIHRAEHGLTARVRVGLTDADATAFFAGRAKPPISGRLALQIDGEGEGLSPIALIGSVTGGGTITLDGGALTGLGPEAFGALTRAVDQGTMLDAPRIHDTVSASLEGGPFDVRHLEAPITLTLGQAHLGATVKHEDVDLAVNADVDLSQGGLDARLTLTGSGEANASELRPDVLITLKGPIDAPRRALELSSLASWLTLRAVERQTRRLEVIDASRREPSPRNPQAQTGPLGPARDEAAPVIPEPNQAPGRDQKPVAPSAFLPLQAPEPLPKTIETNPPPLSSEPKPLRPSARTGLRAPSAAATSRPRPKTPSVLPFNLWGRP
jgi:uncharacterized protein involved in outer membrane biogenesis